MICDADWKRWSLLLDIGQPQLDQICIDMRMKLDGEEQEVTANIWHLHAWKALEMVWARIDKHHKAALPEMGCQRTGRCCMKGVPRVSLFEIAPLAQYIMSLPAEDKIALIHACRVSINKQYSNPTLGYGVPCPLLGTGKDGKPVCKVHPVRPFICRASAVTTPTSWDCGIWQVYKNRFPVIEDKWADPFLELFGHLRKRYSILYLKDPSLCQMALIGVGVLYTLGIEFPTAPQPEVTTLLTHRDEVAKELWRRTDMNPPDIQVVN